MLKSLLLSHSQQNKFIEIKPTRVSINVLTMEAQTYQSSGKPISSSEGVELQLSMTLMTAYCWTTSQPPLLAVYSTMQTPRTKHDRTPLFTQHTEPPKKLQQTTVYQIHIFLSGIVSEHACSFPLVAQDEVHILTVS